MFEFVYKLFGVIDSVVTAQEVLDDIEILSVSIAGIEFDFEDIKIGGDFLTDLIEVRAYEFTDEIAKQLKLDNQLGE